MSDTPDASRIPLMSAAKAQEIARGLKWLAQSYSETGMVRDATRAERDSHWWLNHSISLAQTPLNWSSLRSHSASCQFNGVILTVQQDVFAYR